MSSKFPGGLGGGGGRIHARSIDLPSQVKTRADAGPLFYRLIRYFRTYPIKLRFSHVLVKAAKAKFDFKSGLFMQHPVILFVNPKYPIDKMPNNATRLEASELLEQRKC